MGREIKRVAVDFNWPLNKIWPGYNIDLPECGQCPPDDEWTLEAQCAFHRMIWDDYTLSPSIDPPAGDGWQLWETVSEGSPISPVFPEKDGLVGWLMSPANSWGISRPMSRQAAERFVDAGYAPTMVYTPETGLVSGEQWAGQS